MSGTFVTKRGMGFNSSTYLSAWHELYTVLCCLYSAVNKFFMWGLWKNLCPFPYLDWWNRRHVGWG